jgi:hypothetical protein
LLRTLVLSNLQESFAISSRSKILSHLPRIPSPPDPVVRWAAVISATAAVIGILIRLL